MVMVLYVFILVFLIFYALAKMVTNMTHVYSSLVLTYISILHKSNFYLYQILILD